MNPFNIKSFWFVKLVYLVAGFVLSTKVLDLNFKLNISNTVIFKQLLDKLKHSFSLIRGFSKNALKHIYLANLFEKLNNLQEDIRSKIFEKSKLNEFIGLVSLFLIISTFGQFLSINVKAASPGPFWTWSGSGIPTKIPNSENFDSVSVGGAFFNSAAQDYYIALEGANTYAWGLNNNGQLGTGDNINLSTPTLVPALAGLKQVSTGWFSTLGLKSDGTVLVWGGGNTNPVQVNGLSNIVDIYMNGYDSGLAVDNLGNVYTVGNNQNSAVLVPGIVNAVQVSSGFAGKYALDRNGKVWAWGGNSYGQLGNGTLNDNPTPTIVQGLPQIKSIASGADSIIVLDVNGDVWAWGSASQNQIGQGETQPNQTTPLKVLGLPPIKEISMNGKAPKAIDFNQKVWEWGENRTGGQSNIPTNISNPANPSLFMLADSGTLKTNGRATVAKRDLIVQAELDISQSAGVSFVSANDTVTYTINYKNIGSVVAGGIEISDELLPDLSFISCSNSCVNTGQNVKWTLPDLAVGDSGSVTLTASVSASIAIGKLSNTALISSTNALSNSAVLTLDVVAPATPGLNLNKTASQTNVTQNGSYFYTLSYSNTLPTSVDNVVITDTLDPRLTISGLPGQCSNSSQDIICNLGTLNPGDSGSLDIYVNVSYDAAAGILVNTAIIDSDQTEPKAVGNTITINPSNNNNSSGIQISKTASTSTIDPGNTINYSINIINKNNFAITDFKIADNLDPRFYYNNDCNYGCNNYSNYLGDKNVTLLTWYGLYMSADSTITLNYSVNVGSNAAPGDAWNTVVANYDENINGTSYQGAASSSVNVTINEVGQNNNNAPSTAFTVTKTPSVTQANPGDTFDYNISVQSQGYDGNFDFLDNLDPRLDLISCNVCSQNGQSLTFSDYLSQNSTNNYTITVQVKNPAAAGQLANTAFVTRPAFNGGVSETKAATALIQILNPNPNPNLQISKTSSKAVLQQGDVYSYTLNYANIGNTNVTNTLITDVLDPRLDFISCTGSCNQSGQNLSWNVGSLGASNVGNLTVTVSVKNDAAPGILANTAQILSDQTTPVAGITYVRIEKPTPATAISISKTANKSTALPGEQIVYTLNYVNTGNVDLTGGIITDTLDSKLDFVSCSGGCVQAGQTITWNLTSVPANINTNLTVTVSVKNNAASGILANTAIFKTNETPQVNSSVNVNIGSVIYLPLNLTKTASQSNVTPNTTYTYTINYQNPNSLSMSNTSITDVLDPRLDFVSCSNSCTQSGQNLSWNIGSLNANESGSVIITVKVKILAASGVLNNTALAQTAETTQSSASVQVIVDAPVPTQPLNITKSASQNNVNRNSNYTYTINYQNPNSATSLTNVAISDILDNRLDFVSCSNSCTQSGQNLSWNIGSLNANESGSVTVTVKVKNVAAYGILSNTAFIDSAETISTSASSFVSVSPINSVAVPTLVKTQNKTEIYRGDVLTYTIDYSNNSDVNFSNTVITDVLNSNLSFVSCSDSCSQVGQTLTWNIGALNIGSSGSLTIVVNVKSNANLGLLPNIASMSTTESPMVSASSYGAIIINDPISTSSINISKSSTVSTASRGDTYSYNLSFVNGATDLTNVIISDTLDPRLTFVSCSNSCNQSGQNISWNIGNILANATGTVTITVSVKNNASLGGLDNIAIIDSTETTPVNSNKVTVAIAIPDNPTLSISKTVNSNTVAPGGNLTYTINYNNTAFQPVSNVIITDILDSNLSFVSCSNSCNQSGQNISWNIGNLTANASGSVTLNVSVDNLTSSGLIDNTASIDSDQTNVNSATVSTAVIESIPASISLVKSSSASTLHRGDTFTYTITYANSSKAVTNTSITDILDSNLSFVSCSAGCNQSGASLTWNIGNLAANQTGSVTVTVQIKSNASLGSLDNIATIDSTETSPKTASTNVSVIIDDPTPVLNLAVNSDKTNVNPGQNIIYTVNYSNPSTTSVTNTQIQTTLDPGVSLVTPCNNQCSQSGQIITWNIGDLAAGANGILSFEVKVDNNANVGLLTSTLDITSTQSAPSSYSSSVAVLPVIVPVTPTLSIAKSANQYTVYRGNNVNYTISYLNGNIAVNNAVISDILDSRLTFVSCSNACTQSGQNISWNLGNLLANQSGTVTLVVSINSNANLGNLDNTASIISNQTPSNSSTSTIALIVNDPTPTLNINKTASAQTLEPGSNLTYTINYSNPSPVNATNALISDILDSRLTFVSCSNACTQSGQNISWNIGNLNSGAFGDVTLTVLVSSSISNSLISNTAQIQATSFNPALSTISVAVARVLQQKGGTTLIQNQNVNGSNLNIVKTADKKVAQPGENISFNIKYSNDGPQAIQNVEVNDNISKYLIILSCSNSCSIDGQNVIWKLGSVASGQSGTLTISAQVKAFPNVLGVNSSSSNQNPTNPVAKVDLSESKATIKGDNTLSESSIAAVAVFDITAGTGLENTKVENTTEENIVKPILVRTGAIEARNSQLVYIILEISLLGFVYLSLLEYKNKKY